VPGNGSFRIATMTRADVDFAVALAADEGWNPGLHDAEAFQAADPDGFLVGTLDGRPIACISAVSYERRFGFIGLYIVVPDCRGKGYGIALWRAGMERLAGHNVGLDGVEAQQDNYRRSGFRLAYRNIRFELAARPVAQPDSQIVGADHVPFGQLADYDRTVFPAGRHAFLRRWIAQPAGAALALVDKGRLRGYGVIRPCRKGSKIGPLFADDREAAERLFGALGRHAADGQPIYLDVPEVNAAGMQLAQDYAMNEVFGTARMYTGEFPQVATHRVFGVMTFELG
jgi:hypothetical protein